MTHATGGLLAFDLTRRSEPQLVARVRLPLVALGVAIDRTRMRAYVSGATGGLAIVDLAALATTTLVDADVNGVDDRVLEVVPIPEIQPGSPAVVLPDLGLVFVGGDGGAASIAVGAPVIVFVSADGSVFALSVLAPLGVPTRNVGTVELPRELPASFRIRVALPGFARPRGEARPRGPRPRRRADRRPRRGRRACRRPRFHRRGRAWCCVASPTDPTDEGSHWYESDVVVAIADLRAARDYTRTPARERRRRPRLRACAATAAALGIPADAREILSGETIRARFPEAMIARLAPIYDAEAAARGREPSLRSVRWEMAPSPAPGAGAERLRRLGDVVPGTLLHSGEFTHGAVDLAVAAGRGLDFAFARSYRNQTIGSGPLGPGWDFGYRLRLRTLPDGDVELYDGSGRRETFSRQSDDTL